MAERQSSSAVQAFETRAREFLHGHKRIVGDFERSLKNARHFITLAAKALEQEPEGTVTMLEQIREIDLLRHVTHQFEEYEGVVAMLPAALVEGDPTLPDAGPEAEIKRMRARYEALVREAEDQAEEMEKILSALTAPH